MIQQVSYLAPDESARQGLLLGTVNTIYMIWGPDEAINAFKDLSDVQGQAIKHIPREKADLNPQTDIGEDITTLLAIEGSLHFGRN